MKKIKTLAIVCLVVVLPIMILRSCERSRLMRGLDARSRQLDALLDKEQHDTIKELAIALNSYLAETKFALNQQGMLFGSYFSSRDKQIIFDNASKRLMRMKQMLLTNPSFLNIELPNLDFTVDVFFEKVGIAAYNNKDQVVIGILKRWTDSGERESIYITKDERDQHKMQALAIHNREEEKKWQQALAERERNKANEPVIPGIEGVQRLKQREVVRVSRLLIPLEKLDQYLGQKMTFTLKNGRQIVAKCANSDQDSVAIDFSTEGSPLVMKIAGKDIDKIEKVTREKVLEMYDPTMERESTLKPGFRDLVYLPYPRSKEYMGFVTLDNKMVFISIATGSLLCHSKENHEGYKPMVTSIPENQLKDFQISLYYPNKESKLNIVFELRLIKDVPGSSTPIIIYCKDLVLNAKTVRSIFYAQNVDGAIAAIGNPKYGKGELPWEYELMVR